jgi:aspartyl-tRNA(Asn)/glutamyl-tRNA(Gln) amidotransferase subunit C
MITDKEVSHIASLSRLELDDVLRERMKKDLSSILDFVAQLERVDTSGVEPLYQVTGLQNALRADGGQRPWPIGPVLTDLLVGQAPHRHDRFVKVKSIKAK